MMFHTHRLYSAQQSRELDKLAIEGSADEPGIPSYTLMSRAAKAVYEFTSLQFPQAHAITVIAGAGNNAGDGYLFARLAAENGHEVYVYSLVDPETLGGDALQAYFDWQEDGGQFTDDLNSAMHQADLIIDAVLGTGLSRPLDDDWADLIETINALDTPVVSIDIPSGLHADTGQVMGAAIIADFTVCFICLKKGMFTGLARNHCGEIIFNDLQVPPTLYSMFNEEAHLLIDEDILPAIKPRTPCTHKGQTGHLLIVGGNRGMAGAVILAAQGALRSGVGRVTVVTRPEHVAAIVSVQPEIMALGIKESHIPDELLQRVNAIAIGPGLGRDDWGRKIFDQVIYQPHHKILDADALFHLPDQAVDLIDGVITPHPGEAARLLSTTVDGIEDDRYTAIDQLFQEYNAVTVLKGAGTLIYDGYSQVDVCPFGNPGMATAGMGDVLTGVIAGLISQGYNSADAARLGVCIHAQAADSAAEKGETGLMASDLLPYIRQRINL